MYVCTLYTKRSMSLHDTNWTYEILKFVVHTFEQNIKNIYLAIPEQM